MSQLLVVFAFGCLVSGVVALGLHQERLHRRKRALGRLRRREAQPAPGRRDANPVPS